MIFKRKIYEDMLSWKSLSHGESALMLEGARRIGKSTIVKEFVKNEYESYIILDFAKEEKDVLDNFRENIGNLDTFFRNLFLLKGTVLEERKSVIVFDEVQLFPLARQAIKYLVEDGRFDYIETGSLISIKKNVKDILIPSEEYRIKMYPMDFEEFLWAGGDTITGEAIRESYNKKQPMGDKIHRKIMQKFRTYMAVGGMPQAVASLVKGRSFQEIDVVKRNILALYEDDLKKYDDENREKASVVFQTIPEQLTSHGANFRMSKIDKYARIRDYMGAVSFVAESQIGNCCVNVTEPEVALELYADRSNFKLYMADTGLLVTQIMKNSKDTDNELYKALIFDKLSVNQGMIVENMVAQMLRCAGYDLFFHEYIYKAKDCKNEKKYEIDFLLVKNRRLCPIEVKSSGYTSHKSFDYFIKKYQIKVNDRYIIYTKDLKVENGVTYIPLYMTMCM